MWTPKTDSAGKRLPLLNVEPNPRNETQVIVTYQDGTKEEVGTLDFQKAVGIAIMNAPCCEGSPNYAVPKTSDKFNQAELLLIAAAVAGGLLHGYKYAVRNDFSNARTAFLSTVSAFVTGLSMAFLIRAIKRT